MPEECLSIHAVVATTLAYSPQQRRRAIFQIGMKTEAWAELESLKSRQSRVEIEVVAIRERLENMEGQWREAELDDAALEPKPATTLWERSEAAQKPFVSGELPPIIALHVAQRSSAEPAVAAVAAETAPKPAIPDAQTSVPGARASAFAGISAPTPAGALHPIFIASATTPEAEQPAEPEKSFELRLGTYWLVRVGIVMVLTALVFFGNLAYHNIVSKLGPGGKVALLYLASFGLLGLGAFLSRQKSRQTLANYAQVLSAGGLAAVYFTTFAAHHFANLRVIHSPVLDGILLLFWAGVIAGIADRRKSEVLALFAIGLGCYTSIITQVGYFTLVSNLILSCAAVFFLVRNRWAGVGVGSMVAAYGSYAFWRFFHDGQWAWAVPDATLWFGTGILTAYWLVYTAAVFLSRAPALSGKGRAGFLSFNNGAYAGLFLLTMALARGGDVSFFLMAFGAVLVGLSVAASSLLREEKLARDAYLTQGLVLITVGIIVKFSGTSLALMLAAETLILLLLGQQQRDKLLLGAAHVSAALSAVFTIATLDKSSTKSIYLGVAVGALMFASGVLRHRATQAGIKQEARLSVGYFALLSLGLWSATTSYHASPEASSAILALTALAVTLSMYVFRAREFALVAQLQCVLALFQWIAGRLDGSLSAVHWSAAAVAGSALALSHWWQVQKIELRTMKLYAQGIYGVGIILVSCLWVIAHISPEWQMVAYTGLAVCATAYAVATRLYPLAGAAQMCLIPAVLLFLFGDSSSEIAWLRSLAPIAALGLLSGFATYRVLPKMRAEERLAVPLLAFARVYRWGAVFLALWWIRVFVPESHQTLVCAGVGAAVFACAGWLRNQELLRIAGLFMGVALANYLCYWQWAYTTRLFDAVSILLVLAMQRAARAFSDRYNIDERIHSAWIIAGGITLWVCVSRAVLAHQTGFYLTASWSIFALAVFAWGFTYGERVYRWLGLGILACALLRVGLFDIWRLDTMYRILSLLALGIVLLVLGFVYSRFQEKIRRWL